MKHPAKFVFTALVFLLFSANAARAQSGNGTIRGTVTGPSGRVVAGARVYLQTSDGRKPKTEVSDENGRFLFALLPPLHYQVRAHHGELWSDWQRLVRVRVGEQTNIKLQLKRKPAPKKN